MPPPLSPEAYLTSKDFKLRSAPGEWQTQCFACGDKNKYGHLYVNKEHGAFICHRCGQRGSFYTFQKLLGDEPVRNSKQVADKWDLWERYVSVCQDQLIENPEVMSYLKDRGLTPSTIGKYRLGWAGRDTFDLLLKDYTMADLRHGGLANDENYPLWWDRIILPYFQRDHVVTIRAKQVGGNVLQAKDTSVHLFGSDNLRGFPEAYICEGEMDAMLLDQMGFPACAIPGAGVFQEHWATWFEAARRVFVVLDADDAGRAGAARVLQVLGRKARQIDLPVPRGETTTDVGEYFLRDLHLKEDFEVLISRHRGSRIFTFGDGIRDRDELMKLEGLKLGWRDLDWAIEPGLLPGQLVTVLAKTGAGKTAFLTQIIHNLSAWSSYKGDEGGPGVPILCLSLEQTRAEMSHRIERIGRFHNYWVPSEEMARWHCNMRMCDENRIPSHELPVLVDEFIEDVGESPRLLIVDYLGYWSRSFKAASKYEQVSDAVMELKRYAKELGLVIIAPHQVSRVGKAGKRLELDFARDSGVVEETSDFVFSLFRPSESADRAEMDELQRADARLQLLKSRHGNVGKEVAMLWAPYSLSLVSRSHQMEQAVRREWIMDDAQASYEEVVEMHRGKPLQGLLDAQW